MHQRVKFNLQMIIEFIWLFFDKKYTFSLQNFLKYAIEKISTKKERFLLTSKNFVQFW